MPIQVRKIPRDYTEQTYNSPYWFVSFPHRRRYDTAAQTVRQLRPSSLLDYGAGDGHVLQKLTKGDLRSPGRITLYEPVPEFAQLARNSVRLTDLSSSTEVLETLELGERQFDFIMCLGVLEHMPLPERERFYRTCETHLAPNGFCLIDVPVEIGPSLLLKELVRLALKGRSPEYSAPQLLRAMLGRTQFDPARYALDSTSTWIHYHTGFDYRLFEKELSDRFEIVGRFGCPFSRLPPWMMNQEVFYLVRTGD